MKKHEVTGASAEVLGVSAAIGDKGRPIAIVTIRKKGNYKEVDNLFLDYAALQRLVEDCAYVLKNYPTLAEGAHQEVSLAEIEEIVYGSAKK